MVSGQLRVGPRRVQAIIWVDSTVHTHLQQQQLQLIMVYVIILLTCLQAVKHFHCFKRRGQASTCPVEQAVTETGINKQTNEEKKTTTLFKKEQGKSHMNSWKTHRVSQHTCISKMFQYDISHPLPKKPERVSFGFALLSTSLLFMNKTLTFPLYFQFPALSSEYE